jgi:hypothetical protein
MSLVITFSGWCVIRLATDPDPSDEPYGISGYTFALAGEPPLDRIIRFQPEARFVRFEPAPARTMGVSIDQVTSIDAESGAQTTIDLGGPTTVDLLGEPMLENRNGTLAQPGFEPIVPFDLEIKAPGLRIGRRAPLNPDDPRQPLSEVAEHLIKVQAANGYNLEPETVGRATGIWDPAAVVTDRRAKLLEELGRATGKDELAALQTRIAELDIAVNAMAPDRRVFSHHGVERFGFTMKGERGVIDGDANSKLPKAIDVRRGWEIAFWLGAWDADLMCAWAQGSLTIPYAADPPRAPDPH